MTDVFVIRNQSGHYWGKKKTWVDGREAKAILRVENRDEASNTLFELSAKDFELRGDIVSAELNEKGEPDVEISDIPLPEVPQEEPAEPTDEEDSEEEAAPAEPATEAKGSESEPSAL